LADIGAGMIGAVADEHDVMANAATATRQRRSGMVTRL
jgi:hypothetical protein